MCFKCSACIVFVSVVQALVVTLYLYAYSTHVLHTPTYTRTPCTHTPHPFTPPTHTHMDTCITYHLVFPIADTISEIQSNFTSHRGSLPAMFIATPLEKAESIWTEPHPTPPILSHIRRVARKAYDVLSAQLDPPTRREGEGQVPPRDINVGLRSTCRLHCY